MTTSGLNLDLSDQLVVWVIVYRVTPLCMEWYSAVGDALSGPNISELLSF